MSKKLEKGEGKEKSAVEPAGVLTLKIHDHEEEYPVMPKEFRTGSRGFFVSGKFNALDGKRYQLVVNIVEIGSKPKA